jgi:hypothetical protein
MSTKAPVPLHSDAPVTGKVSVKISKIKRINYTGRGIGEISGPALAVTFTLKNGSGKAIDLGSVTANMEDAKGIPSSVQSGPPSAPFSGQAAPGSSQSGTYVFRLMPGYVDPVTISFSYSTEAPVVLFKGTAP